MPKILILSSNPRRDLNLDREVSDLTTVVQRLGKFEIGLGLGVRSQELPGLLAEHSPQIVHFCGHGAGKQGLVFQDENGQERLVSTEILARLFKTFKDEINCVVLNACDSDQQSQAIVAHINYVVGMSQPILDKAAYYFATGFYQGLAAGKSVEQAYELGCLAIQLWSEGYSQSTQTRQYRKAEYVGPAAQPAQPDLPEHLKPVLRKKNMLLPPLEEVSLVQAVSPLAPPNLPAGFEDVVRQEIDRKEYKDQARDAYDNFGQFSFQKTADLSKSEYKQRQILLGKVKQFWIEGFLQPCLQNTAALRLDLKARPDAIADLSQGIEALSVELDSSYERLQGTQIYEEMGQGRTLLILGSPGAGKTIALLQLAQRLIERSEQNLSLPMPVVFNLSSWAKDRKSIVDWLIDELREKYQVPKSLSEPWIRQQQLILLLDGLDEVKEYYRNDCVRTLNEFIGLFPQTEVAVCSRVRDYEALTERLQINSALCLQPLSPKQVYQFLDSVGGSLAGLKALLKSDVALEQFAQTPLILNFMSVAYQGWSVEKLMHELGSTSDQNQHLFDIYIDRRLERGTGSDYSKDQVLRWLSWLASRMVQEKQTIFLIEKVQPTWLQDQSEERVYAFSAILFPVLTVGLAGALMGAVMDGLDGAMRFGWLSIVTALPIYGLDITTFPVLTSAGLHKKISLSEQLSWSWQEFKFKLVRKLLRGLIIFGLIFGLIPGLIIGLTTGLDLSQVRFLLIFGPIFGLIFGLSDAVISAIVSSELEQRTVPNQGTRNSQRNGIIMGLTAGLFVIIAWLLFGLTVGSLDELNIALLFGLTVGLFFGLKYGGAACIQHFALRQRLHQKGRIPWNYAKFLNFASDRLLMKKVGGGYVFFHRMLLEHFAQMNRSES